ncbi:MAG: hypothetical protein J0H07_12705 [Sphingobacteriales bacterium]|nr:hypothetical protein [Sphingobacteriales bacterium]
MHNHSIRVFPGHPLHSVIDRNPGMQVDKNEEKKEGSSLSDEEIIIRLNIIAGRHPFCRYRKVKSHDPL